MLDKEMHQKRKTMVLTHYGCGELKCVMCGFSDIRALSLDHIKGNGAEERKLRTSSLYLWVIKNKFPLGYQTLCMNCQFIKRVENNECSNYKRNSLSDRDEVIKLRVIGGRKARETTKITKKRLVKWMRNNGGEFATKDLMQDFRLTDKEHNQVNMIIYRMAKNGELERIDRGTYKLGKKVERIKIFR